MYQAASPSPIMEASDEQYLRERILPIFNALVVLQVKGLPADFDHFKPVIDIYETDNDHPAYDWETKLGNEGEAWIITYLHYSKCGTIRTTSRGRSWNGRRGRHEMKSTDYSNSNLPEDLKIFSWMVNRYDLRGKNKGQAANGDQERHCKYTMDEYTPKEDRPLFALCKLALAPHKRRPRKFHLHKDLKIEDGYFTKFEKGETSCSGHQCMEQGCDYKHSNGQYRTAHERRGIQEIADKIDELGQYCSKSLIIKRVLSFLDLLVVPNSPDNAVPHSSSRSKRTTPAPMNNKYKRRSSSTSTKERCMNENGPHLTIERKVQNPCNSFQMVEMNSHQNRNQMNDPINTPLPTIPQTPKPGEINPNTMEQGSWRSVAVQQSSTRVAASTNVFTSTAQHIGGQNSTMMNIPTNKSFHTIPEASRYGDINPNTMEQDSLRSSTVQQFTAGMAVYNNGFMGMAQQNVGQNSSLLHPINNSLHTSPEFSRFGEMNPDTIEQGLLSSIPGLSVGGAGMTVFPDDTMNTPQQNVGPNSKMMNWTNDNYPSTIPDEYPVETNPHEMEQSSLGPISVEPAGLAAPSNGFTSTGTARQTGGSNSLIYSSGNNDHDYGLNGSPSDFLKLDDKEWFNWKDQNLRSEMENEDLIREFN